MGWNTDVLVSDFVFRCLFLVLSFFWDPVVHPSLGCI
jgi:hypothetical protein